MRRFVPIVVLLLAILLVSGIAAAQTGFGCADFAGAGRANVRSGPGLTYPVIGSLDSGECAPVFEVSNGDEPEYPLWVNLLLPSGDDGFIAASLFDLQITPGVSTPIPTMQPTVSVTPTPEGTPTAAPAQGSLYLDVSIRVRFALGELTVAIE